jgi:hypothetical protein
MLRVRLLTLYKWLSGERLVRYVKENFIVGRTFINITDLNHAARTWCYEKNSAITRCRSNGTALQAGDLLRPP